MISAWTKNLTNEKDKERFINSFKGSRDILDRLEELLKEEESKLDRSETDVKSYDLPNWEYRQAHKNGYRQCLSIVKNLITADQAKDI